MSYWVSLNVNNEPVLVSAFDESGTIQVGGCSISELNVTYNYSQVFSLLKFSLRDLHEKTALETTPKLEELAGLLPNKPYRDYWAPTPGNAGAVVHRLLLWAKQYPDAVWRVN